SSAILPLRRVSCHRLRRSGSSLGKCKVERVVLNALAKQSRLCRLNLVPRAAHEDRISDLARLRRLIYHRLWKSRSTFHKTRRWNALSTALGTYPGRKQKS